MKDHIKDGSTVRKTKAIVNTLSRGDKLMQTAHNIELLMHSWRPVFKQTRRTLGELVRTPGLKQDAVKDFESFKNELLKVNTQMAVASGWKGAGQKPTDIVKDAKAGIQDAGQSIHKAADKGLKEAHGRICWDGNGPIL